MRADFENVMKEQIEEGIERKESSGTKNPLLEEVMQHTSFCQNKCKLFYGRKETLEVHFSQNDVYKHFIFRDVDRCP